MTRYTDEYSGTYHTRARPIIVPENVERLSEHEPCFRCGQARGCRHRRMAA